jgi:arylsulfatase A-like enzyme/Flp pilus assembly protein TadD
MLMRRPFRPGRVSRAARRSFRAARRAGISVLAGMLLSAGCGGANRSETSPNLILITLDTTRADRLGCYGYEPAITPTLDSLATRGVLFESAIASVPITLPSHSTILTGLSPLRTGVRDNGMFSLAPHFETVAEHLLASGYQTGAFVSAFVLDAEYGTSQGFTTYDDKLLGERPALLTNRRALRWIETLDRNRPYFLWIHYYDPHLPWTPPEPFRSMEELAPYDQEIAGLDAALGSFLRELHRRGFLDRTGILISGDHGEGLFDHGEPQHGVFLYDETIRVPMMLLLPDQRWAGRRVQELVATEDITPTLLSMAGAAVPDSLDGHDLIPILAGDVANPRSYVYSETYFPAYDFHFSQIFSLRSQRWKYIHAPRPELYHVRRDPGETIDLLPTYPDTGIAYRERLDELRGRAGVDVESARAISQEEIERLQSLGYLGGGEFAAEMDPHGEFNLPDPKDLKPFLPDFDDGLTALHEDRFADAVEHLERVISHHPENVIARMNLARGYEELEQPEMALVHLEEAAKLAPNSSTCKKNLAMVYQELGRYHEALENLQEIAEDPTHGEFAMKEIGRTQLLMGRPEDALLTFRELADRVGGTNTFSPLGDHVRRYLAAHDRLAVNPNDESARLALAEVAIDLRLLEEARRLLQFQSSSSRIEGIRRRDLGSVAGANRDYATALREFETALQHLPGDVYIRNHLVALYLESGDLERALATAEELIRDGNGSAQVYYNKACALSRSGDVDGSFEAIRRAISRGYDDFLQLNRDPELEALRKDPRFPELLETVGDS